ncbi:MAG: trehalose synthase [Bacteroidia bacterium]|nr:trehalose synthase [Bacteroidia bacterium]MDW8300856.1 trehalose synthase [Bacteroidia bacterium]
MAKKTTTEAELSTESLPTNTLTDSKDKGLTTDYSWLNILEDKTFLDSFLNKYLPKYLQTTRWFGGKGRVVKQLIIQHALVLPVEQTQVYLLIIESIFAEGFADSYFLPIHFSTDEYFKPDEKAIICSMQIQEQKGLLIDALYWETFRNKLFYHILAQSEINTGEGILQFNRGKILEQHQTDKAIESILLKTDQSNTSLIFNDQYFLKIYRRLYRETNPDYEITKFLTENANFAHSPKYAGSISWKRAKQPEVSLGLMQQKVENEGDAWQYLNGQIRSYFNKIIKYKINISKIEKVELYQPKSIKELDPETIDLMSLETLKSIDKLAQRTAEMHIAISSDRTSYTFLPQLYNEDYSVWLKNRMIAQLDKRLALIEQNKDKLTGLAKEYANFFLEKKEEIRDFFLNFDENKLISKRIRIHGDFHLGQVLKQNDDFIILDFEGEPESTIRDRKVKQPPIKDVAGMIRSFHYAVYANIFELVEKENSKIGFEQLSEAGNRYYRIIVAVYLNTYIKVAMANSLDIGYQKEINYLLKYHLLEKAIYELGYELNSRPSWAIIPLQGIVQLLTT